MPRHCRHTSQIKIEGSLLELSNEDFCSADSFHQQGELSPKETLDTVILVYIAGMLVRTPIIEAG
jgi:hypothetical protein